MTYGKLGIENAIIPQAELDRLRSQVNTLHDANANLRAEAKDAGAERDRLRAEVAKYNDGPCPQCNQYAKNNHDLRAEVERLRMEVSVRGNMNEGLRAELEAHKLDCGNCGEERVKFRAIAAENERLRGALAQMCLAVKDVKNGNVSVGEFIDCANAILASTAAP